MEIFLPLCGIVVKQPGRFSHGQLPNHFLAWYEEYDQWKVYHRHTFQELDFSQSWVTSRLVWTTKPPTTRMRAHTNSSNSFIHQAVSGHSRSTAFAGICWFSACPMFLTTADIGARLFAFLLSAKCDNQYRFSPGHDFGGAGQFQGRYKDTLDIQSSRPLFDFNADPSLLVLESTNRNKHLICNAAESRSISALDLTHLKAPDASVIVPHGSFLTFGVQRHHIVGPGISIDAESSRVSIDAESSREPPVDPCPQIPETGSSVIKSKALGTIHCRVPLFNIVGQWIYETGCFRLLDNETVTEVYTWLCKASKSSEGRADLGKVTGIRLSTSLKRSTSFGQQSQRGNMRLRFRASEVENLVRIANPGWDHVRVTSITAPNHHSITLFGSDVIMRCAVFEKVF
ncbi:hypothetical protein ACJ72_00713 [Emergomyces africanus]|uniref:Uncharacterized protein n=1 Tax=Emergomyces africanus TaxID=1955775 RepID=A0A1B7P7Q6_9EURO|nr:hypothetical protein ACJ72_00713 [Emergomyces africanus]